MRSAVVIATSVALCGGAVAIWKLPASERGTGFGEREEREGEHEREEEEEGKRVRPSVHRASPAELAVRNRVAQAESAKILARQSLVSVPGQTWVPLGPNDAFRETNFVEIESVDSGRPNNIVADPRDPNVVYMAVSGGGIWKTFDFLAPDGPTWIPLTDAQPNLAVGSLALDPEHPDTLYFGAGDPFDFSGNTVQKSTNGGGSWSSPVVLTGAYPSPSTVVADPGDIRSIAVHGDTVFAGTNVGLFRSTDGGAAFTLVDLPNPDRILTDAIWDVVHIGGGQFVASGATGCDVNFGPPPIAFGEDPGPGCPAGNNAAIWRSDDGVAWTQVATPQTLGTGRVM